MVDQGYKKLDIYDKAHCLAVEIHAMTMALPKHEMYEEGSQIRRSSKSVAAQIVEGYCLRKYKNEFLLYLNRAYASAEETIEHLELLFESNSFANETQFRTLRDRYEELCGKIFRFIQTVNESHEKPYSVREDGRPYNVSPSEIRNL